MSVSLCGPPPSPHLWVYTRAGDVVTEIRNYIHGQHHQHHLQALDPRRCEPQPPLMVSSRQMQFMSRFSFCCHRVLKRELIWGGVWSVIRS